MGHEVKVKAKFKGTSRRFEIHSGISWDELSSKLSNLFHLEPDFRLKYCDDENELVLISSQEELDEALKVYQKKSGLLHLFIEDPSAPQTTDTTLLNLEDRNQAPNQGKKKGMESCYAAAASSVAPECAVMNARLESKWNEEASQGNKPAVSLNDEQTRPKSGASSVSKHEETVHLKYINFSEVMTRPNQQNQSSQQNSNNIEKETFRGWFNSFEDQRQHQPPNHTKSQSKKSKSKTKRSFYSEFASKIAPQLASVKVREPQERISLATASETDDTDVTDISEPPSMTAEAASLSMSSPPSEVSGEKLNSAADFNQQMIQNGQQKVIKRPKRSKKHGKKKSCYAQAALDIGPLYQAMNYRLKELQQQHQNSQDLNGDSEEEMPAEDSPEYESFVFVNSTDGESLSPTSIETEQTVVVDGPPEQPPEQQMDLEPSRGDREMNRNVNQDPTDIKAPRGSMNHIVEQTVRRTQQLNLNQSRQAPSADASTITEVYVTSKVVHKGITCDNCKDEIQGVRYKCGNCRDFDLCEPCESKDLHDVNHVFVKLKFPAPGIGRKHGEMVPIFKNSVYKSTHDKKMRKAEKEEKKAAYKQLKHALKAQEKERKREERYLRKEKQEKVKSEQQQQQPPRQQRPTDPRAQKMAIVYEKLKMEYVRDVSFPDGSVVSPGQKFLKTWAIQNVGTIAWNQWIKLECIEGGIMVTPEKVQGLVPHLEQGEQGEVSVEFIAPELPGTYSSKWHLTYGLHTFGPQLWCEIVVEAPNNAGKPVLRDQTTLVNSAFVNNTPLLEDPKLQAASYHMVDDSGSEYLSSEETQQGRELIPVSDVPLNSMEGQQRQDLEWDAGCVHDVEAVDVSADNDESLDLITFPGTEDIARSNHYNSEDSDDEEDSDSSLDEFTVLVPPCFDPDAPLFADPTPVKVECPKRSSSFSSKYLPTSFEPYLNLDDNEPFSLPTMSSSGRVASWENLAKNTVKPTSVQSAPMLVPDASANQGEETPSGRISPVELSGQRSSQTQTPASIQSHITPGETVPLISHSDPIARVRPHSCVRRTSNGESPLPTNVVSDVLSSAIDVVTNAGKAALATVDNLINGGVQASAVYKPEDECEVTVDRRFDAPPPIVSRAMDNPMCRLIEMGFADRRLNEQLLRKHNNDLRATIDELLSHTENDWSSQRH